MNIDNNNNNNTVEIKPKNKILYICSLATMGIFNVLTVVLIILAKDYYGLMLSASILGIICAFLLIAIADLVAIVGFVHKDFKLTIINIAVSVTFSIVLTIGVFYLVNINSSINNIIDNKGTEQYETINVTLSSYKTDYKDITDCKNKKIGVVTENEVGITSVFKDKLNEEGIVGSYSEYGTTNDLFFALITDEVDIAVFPSNYRMLYEKDDEIDYSHYLTDVHDFYSFEEKIKTGENELANADLTLEPFNILLIGFAPEEGSHGKYGLSDTIIVASVNPKTMEVGLTSIARDSYVPISCYSGHKDKINAARGKSRQCLMDTVGDLLGIEINLYMEANFDAVVQIVDAVGGIDINSPVAFTGQTSSEIRGTYTVQIPAGYYHANGEEALAFARERHAMPAGDFDRQEHQKQVIKEVIAKILETRDINVVTNILKTCGNNLSTNLSMQQITQLFNYLIKIENNTALPLSQVIDMQNARLTGYSSWYYNYSAHLPLWIYKLYDGSIAEAKQHIEDIMNGYDKNAAQKPSAKFFTYYPYSRQDFYHTVFSEEQVHEEMPAYYKTLVGMQYADAVSWANTNGARINLVMILPGQSGYNESQFGQVINQDVPYGSLVSDYPTVTLTVMGNVSGNYSTLENFVGRRYSEAVAWANKYEVEYTINFVDNTDFALAGKVKAQTPVAGTLSVQIATLVLDVYKYPPITQTQIEELKRGSVDIATWASKYSCIYTIDNSRTTEDQSQDGVVIDVTPTGNNPQTGNTATIFVYKYVAPGPSFTCDIEHSIGGTHPDCQCESGYSYNAGNNTCDLNTGGGGEGSGGEGTGGEGSGTGGEGGAPTE